MREVKKRGGRKPRHILLAIIYIIAMLAFSGMLIWLNILPMKYLIAVLAVILVGSVLVVLFLNVKKQKSKRRVAGTIVAILLIAVYGVGMYYIYSTQDLFSKISNIGEETEDYYVIVRSDDQRGSSSDLEGAHIYIADSGADSYEEAEERLNEVASVTYSKVENIFDLGQNLLDGECDTVMVSSSNYSMICEDSDEFEDSTKIIYTLTIKKTVEKVNKSVSQVAAEPFNVYISGIDIFGTIDEVSLSDVNMIMTVNPETKTILLTSIPRDSYVMLHTYQAMDKLTHTGAYGIDESMATIEDMFDTNLNYYIRVNFSTVVDVVDAIGGITVDSDYDFTTHGRQNEGYTFVKGENTLDGKEALAFARERYSFEDGDFQRNKDQQKVMRAMLDKILSSKTLLTKYTQLLDAVEDEMQTSMSTSEIQALVKMQISDMASWDIKTQSITGETGTAYCYSVGGDYSVVYPDENQVSRASAKIAAVLAGEELADGEWTWDYD